MHVIDFLNKVYDVYWSGHPTLYFKDEQLKIHGELSLKSTENDNFKQIVGDRSDRQQAVWEETKRGMDKYRHQMKDRRWSKEQRQQNQVHTPHTSFSDKIFIQEFDCWVILDVLHDGTVSSQLQCYHYFIR